MRHRLGRLLAVAAVPLVAVFVGGGVASATPTTQSTLPWPTTVPGAYSGTDPHGQCNVKYSLPLSGAGQTWGISIACQAAVPSDYAPDIKVPNPDLPGVTSGFATDAPDPAGFLNLNPIRDGGGALSLDGHDPPTSFVNVTAQSCTSCYVGTGATADIVGSAGFWDESWQPTCGGGAQKFGSCTYQGVEADMTTDFSLGTSGTVVGGVTYYPLQFRYDMIFESDGTQPAYNAPGTTSADCPGSSDVANVGMGVTGHGDTDMTESLSCVLPGGNPEAQMPETYWIGGSPYDASGCSLDAVTPGGAAGLNVTIGHVYSWQVSYSAAIDFIIMSPNIEGTGSETLTGAPTGTTWQTGSVIEAATGSPQEIDYTATSTRFISPQFYCVAAGSLGVYGPPGGVGGSGTSCADGGTTQCGLSSDVPACSNPVTTHTGTLVGCGVNLSACLATTGIGLDPISWVPALVKGIACVFDWAFIPESISTSALSSPFTTTFPGTWVADGLNGLSTLKGGFDSAVGASACDAPTLGEPGFSHVPAFSVQLPAPASLGCTTAVDATTGGELFGFRSVVRTSLVFLVWIGALMLCWRFMPWYKGKPDDLPTSLDKLGGSFEDDGSYEYTVQ